MKFALCNSNFGFAAINISMTIMNCFSLTPVFPYFLSVLPDISSSLNVSQFSLKYNYITTVAHGSGIVFFSFGFLFRFGLVPPHPPKKKSVLAQFSLQTNGRKPAEQLHSISNKPASIFLCSKAQLQQHFKISQCDN